MATDVAVPATLAPPSQTVGTSSQAPTGPGAIPTSNPPPAELARIRAFVADPKVPDEAKQAAVGAFTRQYPPPGAGPGTSETIGQVSSGPITRTGGGGIVRPPATPGMGTLSEVTAGEHAAQTTRAYAEPAAAALGSIGAMALVPETGGASALLLPALAAGLGGGAGREAVARAVGGTPPTWTERGLGFLVDALPVAVGSALQKIILSPAELDAAGKALSGEKMPMPARPVLENLPAKPGAKPRAPATAPIPEATPGVPTGALSPLPGAPVPPTIGPQLTRVAADALKATEREAAAKYSAAGGKAAELGLLEPVPQHIIAASADAINALDRSGLDPEIRNGARTLLESIRDVQGEVGEGGEIVIKAGKAPVDRVTYGDLDAWRRKLQEYAPSFAKLGQSQTFEKGSMGHVLGLVKDDMVKMAQGTEVETLHRTAEDFFITEVQPSRKLARAVLRGETEPNAMVDAFTTRAHQEKFARYMTVLDRKAPETAAAFRRVKYQNMIDRASAADGTFRQDAFLKELDAMPGRSRDALLGGTSPNEIKELLHNIEQAKGMARTTQADAQAAAENAFAQAKQAHTQATLDYQGAVARNAAAKQAYRTAADAAKATPPELITARRKLSSQQMLLQAPPAIITGTQALSAAMNGDGYPLLGWMAGEAYTARGLSWAMSSPRVIPHVNRLFRLMGAGASPNAIARTATNIAWHLTEGAGRIIMRPPTPGPQPEAPAP